MSNGYKKKINKVERVKAHKNMFCISGIQGLVCPMINLVKICTVKHLPVQH